MRRLHLAVAVGAAALFASACNDNTEPILRTSAPPAPRFNTSVTGAAFTTVNETVDGTGHCKNGNPAVNCNIYDGKQYVWLNGGPSTAYVGDGSYFFAVLSPGGQPGPNDGGSNNLSDDYDAYTNRTFSVSDGIVSYGGTHDFDGNEIRLADYADTPNPGGVYILAICSLADGYPVNPSDCKYDAFKVQTEDGGGGELADLTVIKDAAGAYTNTFTWGIDKSVDKTLVKQVGGSAIFNYSVAVTHDAGTISGVKVTGTITVTNPNYPNAVTGVDITDAVSDGTTTTTCSVTNGADQTLDQFNTDFTYECDLSALPSAALDNTVTVTWPTQTVDGSTLTGSSAHFEFTDVAFTATLVDDQATITDTYAGTLGTVTSTDPSPTTLTYSRTIPIPQGGCTDYDNTATFTTNTTSTTGSDDQTVTVCGPIDSGGLTMGFWHNKNGQKIITSGAKTANVCNSGTWLRQFAPFQDLSATATCQQVGSYVLGIIDAANASGAAMNAMLKAQMLATALDVYFSTAALGGNQIGAPAPIGGITIDLTMIYAGGQYLDVSSAFGGATSMTVSQMLTYAAGESNVGGSTWYGQVKSTQELAKDGFDAINNEWAFAP